MIQTYSWYKIVSALTLSVLEFHSTIPPELNPCLEKVVLLTLIDCIYAFVICVLLGMVTKLKAMIMFLRYLSKS